METGHVEIITEEDLVQAGPQTLQDGVLLQEDLVMIEPSVHAEEEELGRILPNLDGLEEEHADPRTMFCDKSARKRMKYYLGSDILKRVTDWCALTRGCNKKSHLPLACALERLIINERADQPLDLLSCLLPQVALNQLVEKKKKLFEGLEWKIPMSTSVACFSVKIVDGNWFVSVLFRHNGSRVILLLKGYSEGQVYHIPSLEMAWQAVFECMQKGLTSVKAIQLKLMGELFHMRRAVVSGLKLCIQQCGDVRTESWLGSSPLVQPSSTGISWDSIHAAVERGKGEVYEVVNEVYDLLVANGVGVSRQWQSISTSVVDRELEASQEIYCHGQFTSVGVHEDPYLAVVAVDMASAEISHDETNEIDKVVDKGLAVLRAKRGARIPQETLRLFFHVALGLEGTKWLIPNAADITKGTDVLLNVFEGLHIIDSGRIQRNSTRLVQGLVDSCMGCLNHVQDRARACSRFFRGILEEGKSQLLLPDRIRYMLHSHWVRGGGLWFNGTWRAGGDLGATIVKTMLDIAHMDVVPVKQDRGMGVANALAFLILVHEGFEPPSSWVLYSTLVLVSMVVRSDGAGGSPHMDKGKFEDSLLDVMTYLGLDEGRTTEDDRLGLLRILRGFLYDDSSDDQCGLGSRMSCCMQQFGMRWLMDVLGEPPVGREVDLAAVFPYGCLHLIPFLIGKSIVVLRTPCTSMRPPAAGNRVLQGQDRHATGRPVGVWDVFSVGPNGEKETCTCGSYDAAQKKVGDGTPYIFFCEEGQENVQCYPVARQGVFNPYVEAAKVANPYVSSTYRSALTAYDTL